VEPERLRRQAAGRPELAGEHEIVVLHRPSLRHAPGARSTLVTGSGRYGASVPVLERLRLDHAAALLAFELENRAYFAASVSDRGDDYFRDFHARLSSLLEEQAAGVIHQHVLVEDDGSIVGRINLFDVAGASATLGYRIAQRAAGKGLATAAVHQLCEIAARDYGLTKLVAATSLSNAASQAVLARTGFVRLSETTTVNGRPAIQFVRRLVP
jgi:[ribosomal protein S5]-alanine N-acetyltransferase